MPTLTSLRHKKPAAGLAPVSHRKESRGKLTFHPKRDPVADPDLTLNLTLFTSRQWKW